MAEACYSSTGLPHRVRLHRDVGEAMERLRDRGIAIPSAELAHHFANAAAAGVAAKAVEYAAAAGRESMDQLGYEDAARDFARALAALELCPGRRRGPRRPPPRPRRRPRGRRRSPGGTGGL